MKIWRLEFCRLTSKGQTTLVVGYQNTVLPIQTQPNLNLFRPKPDGIHYLLSLTLFLVDYGYTFLPIQT